MKRAFTLIELMVVVAMILVIVGSLHTAVLAAQRRAKISRAHIEAREMTNAILSFQNYDENRSLDKYLMNDAEAEESRLSFILGGVRARGVTVPVLYNAAITGGKILDPWGRPYRVTIKQGETIRPQGVPNMGLRVFYPNWHRLKEGER